MITVDVARIGDRIHFSVELIEQLREQEQGERIITAKIVEIRKNQDETLTLVLERDRR